MKKITLFLLLIALSVSVSVSSQDTDTRVLYKRSVVIKDSKPVYTSAWKEVIVHKFDTIPQYNRDVTKFRMVVIVFGNDGFEPITKWSSAAKVDTVYEYKRNLNF